MAKSKSTAKRIRTAEKRRMMNKAYMSRLKTSIKGLEKSITLKDADTAQSHLVQVTSLIDKGVSKGIMHKNTAARKKSRFSQKVNAIAVR